MRKHLLVGTAKGLVVYRLTNPNNWKPDKVHFEGFNATMVYCDERHNRWWVGITHKHWGQKLYFSDNQGETWHPVAGPKYESRIFPDGKPAKLRQIWCMAHGGKQYPDRLWLGTDPGGLFISHNNGGKFEIVESLWNHPSRQTEGKWFGAGSDFPFIHSILVNPDNNDQVYIAVSCAGVFETRDSGYSWEPKNNGLIAAYLPNPNVEVGHDPHWLLMPASNTNVLWQQNHCGIFYTSDAANQWHRVSSEQKLPHYGFALAIDHTDSAKAWVIPADSDEKRMAPGLQLQVFQTSDAGKSWQSVSRGLPDSFTFDVVLRQAFQKRGDYLFMGTNNGNLYYSHAYDIHWQQLSGHLPKINTLTIT